MKPPTKRETRTQFAGVSERYRTSSDHVVSDDREALLSLLSPEPSHLFLDVATGGGHTAEAFAPRVRRTVASDLTPEMLREARTLAAQRNRRNVVFVAADAENLPFAPASFDRVACRIAPHHFPALRAAVREMARVLKPGGLVGIIDSVVPDDPALDAFLNGIERVRDPTHVRSCRVEEWTAALAEAGLSVLHVSCMWKEHPFAEWVARTGRPPEVQRQVESMFRNAFPRARDYFRVRIEDGAVVAYSDEKGIFIAKKTVDGDTPELG